MQEGMELQCCLSSCFCFGSQLGAEQVASALFPPLLQVDFLADAQRKLQSEVETRNAKVAELQRQKRELFDKMAEVSSF
jgi:hypothetical protein